MENILISFFISIIFWVVAKFTMKNDFKKTIRFFPFLLKIENRDEKIISIIFSSVSFLIFIGVFFLLNKIN
ncbi:MAG: hypothetical protein WC337_03535 [Candidatus Muiribacteriota bacterium]